MTLEEAIKLAEEVAEINEYFQDNCLESMRFKECAEEHRQLAKWLKDYKRLLEQEPILEKIRAEITDTGAYEQETMGQTAFLNGINYCLGVIDRHRGDV